VVAAPSLSARLVSWTTGETVRTYDVRTRALRVWRIRRALAMHTRNHIFAITTDQRVLWARIPR
jgi:hypothetical protein